MEDELLDETQTEGLDMVEEEIPMDEEPTQDGEAQQPTQQTPDRLSPDVIARDAELKILREIVIGGNRPQPQQMTQPPKQEDIFAEIFKDRSNDDLLTVAEVKGGMQRLLASTEERMATRMRDVSERIARLRYADYDSIIDTYTKELVLKNPDLMDVINRSADPAEAAYLLGRSHPEFGKKQVAAQTTAVAEKIQRNVQKPKTLSSRSSGAPTVSKQDKFSGMSDSDFESYLQNLTGHR